MDHKRDLMSREGARIAVLGDGSIGSLTAAILSRGNRNVSLLCRTGSRAGIIRRRGIRVTGSGRSWLARPGAFVSGKGPSSPADILIVAVKAYDTVKALRLARRVIGKDTLVLTLQNGLGNVENISRVVPLGRVLAGVTTMGATLVRPGVVRQAGRGKVVIGDPSGKSLSSSRKVCSVLASAGMDARVSRDIWSDIWSKLVINCAVNPVAALAGKRNGLLTGSPQLSSVMNAAASEVVSLCRKKGMRLNVKSPSASVAAACRSSSKNVNSMLQDIRKGRCTEIEVLNGEVVRQGASLGLLLPVNRVLWQLVKSIERR